MARFDWSSGHTLLIASITVIYLRLTQPVSPQYFQSIQPTHPFMEQHGQLPCSILTLSEGSRGRGVRKELVGQCYKAYSHIQLCLGLDIHSPLTHRGTQELPVLQAPFRVSALYRWTTSFIPYFYWIFSRFRYAQMHKYLHCVTTAYSIQGRSAARSNRLDHIA